MARIPIGIAPLNQTDFEIFRSGAIARAPNKYCETTNAQNPKCKQRAMVSQRQMRRDKMVSIATCESAAARGSCEPFALMMHWRDRRLYEKAFAFYQI